MRGATGVSEIVRYPRPEILNRLDPSRHAVLEASAGTGKTYTLEHLVVELVLVHEVPIEQILVVTFTEKATREMRERVRGKLRDILVASPSTKNDAEKSYWELDESARRRLSDALAVFDRAPISTIHAFCQRVLTESAFDCARLLRQEQVESRESFGQAFREELRAGLASGAPVRPVLERALQTWGVDRLEANLYRWYVERGQPQPRFDSDGARDALKLLPSRAELAPAGFARRALEQGLSRNPKKEIPARLLELAPTVEAVRAGAPIFEALLSFWDWSQREAPGRKTNLSYLRHYLGKGDSRTLGPLAERIEQLGRSAGSPLTVLVGELVPRIEARLDDRKAQRGNFDFDDMLRMLRDALKQDTGALVRELRRRYRVALVDEFQDTDQVQWDVFRRIFFEPGVEQRLFVIGDPKQAIYGFRNADVHTYHAARAEIEAQGGQIVPLTVCYRARAPVIEAINLIVAEGFFTGVNAYPHPVTCGRPELRAQVTSGADAPAVTLLHLVGRPKLTAGGVRRALGESIAGEIARLLDGGLRVDRGDGSVPLSPSDIHVLCRSRSDADHVGAALAAAGIPHAFYKQEGLFQTEAARHVWELLRALEDPTSSVRRFHAWLGPFFAIPLERLADCRDVPPEHPLVARLTEWGALAEGQRWAELFRSILDDSGIVRRELFASASERRLTDVQHILEVLLEETHRGRRSLPQLVARLGAFIEGRELPAGESGNVHRLESERQAVQVLTMHKSKGLEAEVVFLAGGLSEPPEDTLAPRIFHDSAGQRVAWIGEPTPDVRDRMDRESREEAERLLYVALTRARSKLYLPYFGPPPPGAERDSLGEVSYEIEPTVELEPEPRGAQLDLFFEEPELDAARRADGTIGTDGTKRPPTDVEREYELRRMQGPYRVLNERLRTLVKDGVTNSFPALFERREIVVESLDAADIDPRLRLVGWHAPPHLLLGEMSDAARYERLRRERAGVDVTSYTRMKSAVGGYRAPEVREGPEDAAEEALLADPFDSALPADVAELPGGASVGVFLHEVLEHLPFEAIQRLENGAAMRADESLERLLRERAQRNGVDPKWLSAAADVLVTTLTAPLRLPDGVELPKGLCAVDRRAVELPFLHPIPERSHPTLAEPPPGPDLDPLVVERGFVRGVIDLVFRQGDRYYVVDYKSDRLPDYGPDGVAWHVEHNYLVQARLYTLGTLRALGIHDGETYERRFGGLVYAFLRGMRDRDTGVWSARPSWDDVLEWERELLSECPWGYPLPPRRRVRPPDSGRRTNLPRSDAL